MSWTWKDDRDQYPNGDGREDDYFNMTGNRWSARTWATRDDAEEAASSAARIAGVEAEVTPAHWAD